MTADPLDIAALLLACHRAEIEMLAALADRPIPSVAAAKECGVLPRHFSQDDTFAIVTAIQDAAVGRWDKQRMFDRARAFLKALKLWDEEDVGWVQGSMRWGPGPLAALLCREPFAVKTIVECAGRLLSLAGAEEAI